MSMKNSNDTIRNRNRNPPTCSELHEPNYYYYYSVVIVIMTVIIMDLCSVWAPLLSWTSYCSQHKFNSHKIPRSSECDRYVTNLSFQSKKKCHCAWHKSETFRDVQNDSGDNLTVYVLTAVKTHTAVWSVVTDVSETPQTWRRRRHDPPKSILNTHHEKQCRNAKLLWTFKLRDYTGSFYLTTTSRRRGISPGNCKRQLSNKIKAMHLRRVHDVTAGHLPLNSLINET